MRRLALLTVLATLTATDTATGIVVRPARTADLRPHPGATTEWWAVRAVDPASGRVIDARLRFGQPDPGNIDIEAMEPSGALREARAGAVHFGPGVRVAGRGTEATLIRRRRTHRLRISAPRMSATITVRGGPAGPTVRGWPSGLGVTGWHVPVARGRVDGVVRFEDGHVMRLSGWRGSVEHLWGHGRPKDWQLGEELVVHGRRTSFLVFGRTPAGIPLADEQRDRRWVGALVRGAGRQARACPATVRRKLTQHYLDGRQIPHTVTARCGGHAVTIRDDGLAVRLDFGSPFAIGRGRSAGGLRGLVRHVL